MSSPGNRTTGRVWLDTDGVKEQLRALGKSWEGVVPNLRRKHMGAALRKIANRHIVPIYRRAALEYEQGAGYKTLYSESKSKKTGRTQMRKQVGNLRRSVGVSKLYPGYPSQYAVDIKAGFRKGKAGGGHAMLLAEGTKPRYRKGRRKQSEATKAHDRIMKAAKSGVTITSGKYRHKSKRRTISARRASNAVMLSYKARFGYTGYLHPSQLKQDTDLQAQNIGKVELVKETREALEKAFKEQFSEKYQQVMAKYLAKYGGGGMSNPGRGWFNSVRRR